MKHTISVLVEDRPGALTRIATMFARRGFNIDSLAVGPTERDGVSRITMRVDETLDPGALPLTQTRVTIRLTNGRVLQRLSSGARGYPDRPASQADLDAKFLGCAAPVLGTEEAEALADQILHLDDVPDVRALTSRLVGRQE